MAELAELNAQFPQLEITHLVGRGGMGAIYHARQTSLDRDVALKLIAQEVCSEPAFLERFEREAKTLAKLSHPNIVTIFDYGRTSDGRAYLILEYVDGINLREAMSSRSVGSDEALDIVSTICGALEYAHSKGVIHRDIKPENILIGEDGTLKVADFGIAKIIDDAVPVPTLTATRQVLGTLHYLAPEQIEAPDQVDHRVDLYALGVIFYELLTGQMPLGRYEPPSSVYGRSDQRLDNIVLKTLSRKPQQRYQSAAELRTDIQQFASSAVNRPVASSQNAKPSADENHVDEKSITVPFTCDMPNMLEGLAEAVGVVGVRGSSLIAEFRIRDAFIGGVKSKLHVLEIPRSQLSRVELRRGIFGSGLIITTDRISALGSLPNAETGRVKLKVKRNDESTAREIVHQLGFDAIQTVDRQSEAGSLRWPNEPTDGQRRTFGVLMILCSVMHLALAGALAAFASYWVTHLAVFVALTMALFMSLAVLQLVNGILNLVGRIRGFNIVTCIVSMIPFSPVWVISCPASIWFCHKMNLFGLAPAMNDPSRKKRFGATTLMLIRETRWAKVVGVTGTLAALLIFAGLTVVRNGFYPVDLEFRVVNTSVPHVDLNRALISRLGSSSGYRGLENDPDSVTVKIWQRYRQEIQDLLAIKSSPQLVWLQPASSNGSSGPISQATGDARQVNSLTPISVVKGIDIKAFRTVESSLGNAVVAAGDTFSLESNRVARVDAMNSGRTPKLVIELTSEGRKQLEQLSAGNHGGLGLVIEGLVEGIATRESISQKRLIFDLSPDSELSGTAIEASVRGPDLPTELEQLD
jgi:serine/threonine protein kinase